MYLAIFGISSMSQSPLFVLFQDKRSELSTIIMDPGKACLGLIPSMVAAMTKDIHRTKASSAWTPPSQKKKLVSEFK